MAEPGDLPAFPGAIGLSHLRVYDSEAPDGLKGGTPHVHSVCTEAYYVVAGRGAVQTLTMSGYREVALEPRKFVWFTPGTIHRLVNHDGELEILVLMANAGLPEAGDMVITFPPAVLDDAGKYHDAHVLPEGEITTAGTGDAARRRRDLGVDGFLPLRAEVEAGRTAALRKFYDRAASILGPKAPGWRMVWGGGVARATQMTKDHLEAVAHGDVTHLEAASVHELPPPGDERRMGCCGTLGTYLPLA